MFVFVQKEPHYVLLIAEQSCLYVTQYEDEYLNYVAPIAEKTGLAGMLDGTGHY
jgi:hypothetical protein